MPAEEVVFGADHLEEVARWLGATGWLEPGESIVEVAPAGAGNMNCTLRARTERRSLILKHGRPWVEKYPHIPAPADRTRVEAAFYEVVRPFPAISQRMPALLGFDAEARILMLEDCGAGDWTRVYHGEALDDRTCEELVEYLCALHAIELPAGERQRFRNLEMRLLNHEHIFSFPLRHSNGLDLDAITPGLSHVAHRLSRDREYVWRVTELGRLYLGEEDASLLHGDYFPGSWLATRLGVRVIDPEFAFVGSPEFDVGVMLAHLILAGQRADLGGRVLHSYEARRPLDVQLASAVAAVEIMRRLIGVAQLPLSLSLAQKKELLELSRELITIGVSGERW